MPWETRFLTTYDLVSYGGSNCYAEYNTTTQKGWGPGFEYACIHSGLIESSGDLATNWYNYTLATAGTIIDKDTSSSSPATNTTIATESICPKGWTLPNNTQIQSVGDDTSTYVSSFSPVLGGAYDNGGLYSEAKYGRWWGSTAYNSVERYYLNYESGKLSLTHYNRRTGRYIRCVAKQKTITDLAYMQDVTAGL